MSVRKSSSAEWWTWGSRACQRVRRANRRLRWRATTLRRPPEPDRIPTYAAVAAVATAVVIIPAAMVGALTLARLAAVAAVTCATVAAALLAHRG